VRLGLSGSSKAAFQLSKTSFYTQVVLAPLLRFRDAIRAVKYFSRKSEVPVNQSNVSGD
jgi:hypothetical protein